MGDQRDSRSGDIEPQGEKSLERWLYGIMKPIAEDIAKNCSTAPATGYRTAHMGH